MLNTFFGCESDPLAIKRHIKSFDASVIDLNRATQASEFRHFFMVWQAVRIHSGAVKLAFRGVETAFHYFYYTQFFGVPAVILSFYAPYESGEVKLDADSINSAWVTYEEAKNYDMVEGLIDEIAMIEKILAGKDADSVKYGV